MKCIYLITCFAILILSLLNTGCKKENTINTYSQSTSSPPPATSNTAPNCNVGLDIHILFPTNFYSLYGVALDGENNIQTILWKKISGPSSFLIEQPDSLKTKVSNLQLGVYQFELTVTDSMGLHGKDTIKVTVRDPNVLILENQTWIFPWASAIEVKDFYHLITPEFLFRVFIRRDTHPDWKEASPDSNNGVGGPYEYFIETRLDGAGIYTYGSLYIFYYGMDTNDTPDIKIVF